ncbi:MAG: uncharacterized protein KVP18_000976 [Porospora cf. gigantea A]|uniref:uncharacterized protein n=1 Tax=Porospora cf. gigantea A TaxID=2853593 RepID=UPI00355A4D24|nr:MAG: hypothetical protein KVP18_000976 [Porospora cf. gigantea A]
MAAEVLQGFDEGRFGGFKTVIASKEIFLALLFLQRRGRHTNLYFRCVNVITAKLESKHDYWTVHNLELTERTDVPNRCAAIEKMFRAMLANGDIHLQFTVGHQHIFT